MPIELSVLVLDGGAPRTALAQRLRQLGYRTLRAKGPEDALRVAEDRSQTLGAALIPTDLAAVDLGTALAALAAAAARPATTFVVTGPRPAADGLRELREAGVSLALFEPFDDARLRFQVNRALGAEEPDGLARREQRAPVELAARVLHKGRQKSARSYTLSAAGVYLETQRPAMRGTELELELPIGPGPLQLAGVVVQTNVPGNLQRSNLPVGMGLRFTDVPEAAGQAIRRLVAQVSLELTV